MRNILVLMSTYNGEKYLKEQIDSIRKSQLSGTSGIGLYAHGWAQWQRQHSCPYRNQQFAKTGCAPAALHGATH